MQFYALKEIFGIIGEFLPYGLWAIEKFFCGRRWGGGLCDMIVSIGILRMVNTSVDYSGSLKGFRYGKIFVARRQVAQYAWAGVKQKRPEANSWRNTSGFSQTPCG